MEQAYWQILLGSWGYFFYKMEEQLEEREAGFDQHNYYVVQGWAVVHLNLNIYQLLIYSIIHGFSQHGNMKFTGSVKYLQTATKMSRSTAMKTLKELVEMDLVIKQSKMYNGIIHNSYRTNPKYVSEGSVNHTIDRFCKDKF